MSKGVNMQRRENIRNLGNRGLRIKRNIGRNVIKMNLYNIAFILVLIGAINWLLVGVSGNDLVEPIVGATIAKYVYILVGLSGLWVAYKKFM